jgi:hypothetical protein
MLSTSRSRIRVLAASGLAAAVAVVGVAGPASAAGDARSGHDPNAVAAAVIPEAIKPPAGSRPIGAYVVVTGTQTYTCVVPAGATTGAYTGSSVPEARLIGTRGRIHHFAGPSWQSERDGSLVTGRKVAESPRTGTIPELLLQVVTHSGTGILDKADYISRLYTSGGLAPTGSCASGATAAVPYKAVYVFWDAPAV